MSNEPLNSACGAATPPTQDEDHEEVQNIKCVNVDISMNTGRPNTPRSEQAPHSYAQESCEFTWQMAAWSSFLCQNHQKRLKKEIGACKVNKGEAAYLWSARFSQAHRPPRQHSWSGNNQLCLSSLQQQNTGFAIKRTTSKLEEQTNIFNTRPATEARASVCFRQPHVLFKKSTTLSCAVRGDENEG